MRHAAVFVVVVILLLLTPTALAKPVAAYDLSRWTVDGGGVVSGVSGGYILSGAIGQSDAGTLEGEYTLTGGFWVAGKSARFIYLPLVLR